MPRGVLSASPFRITMKPAGGGTPSHSEHIGVRSRTVVVGYADYIVLNTQVPLVPPKPKEFDMETDNCMSRAVFAT